MANESTEFLLELETVIRARASDPTEGSYTTSLFAAGSQRIAQKVGEEAVELALAAAMGNTTEVVEEAADLMYHVLVLLTDQGISFNDVATALKRRHQSS